MLIEGVVLESYLSKSRMLSIDTILLSVSTTLTCVASSACRGSGVLKSSIASLSLRQSLGNNDIFSFAAGESDKLRQETTQKPIFAEHCMNSGCSHVLV